MRTLNGRARYLEKFTHANQGGGDKKGGLPFSVGRSSWTTIAIGTSNCSNSSGSCVISRLNAIPSSARNTTKGMVGVFVPGLRWR